MPLEGLWRLCCPATAEHTLPQRLKNMPRKIMWNCEQHEDRCHQRGVYARDADDALYVSAMEPTQGRPIALKLRGRTYLKIATNSSHARQRNGMDTA